MKRLANKTTCQNLEYCHFSSLIQLGHVIDQAGFSAEKLTQWFFAQKNTLSFILFVLITKLSIRLSCFRTIVSFRELENLLRFFCHIYTRLTTVFPSQHKTAQRRSKHHNLQREMLPARENCYRHVAYHTTLGKSPTGRNF